MKKLGSWEVLPDVVSLDLNIETQEAVTNLTLPIALRLQVKPQVRTVPYLFYYDSTGRISRGSEAFVETMT